MHEQGIGTARNRRIDQRQTGGYAGDNVPHFGATFHLQAVWAIIPETRRIQLIVKVTR